MLFAACGAKTGLDVGDAGPDSGHDAGMDAGPHVTCIEASPDAGRVTADLTLPVALAVVDVFFLVDSSGSMLDEIDNVRSGLRTVVVPGIRASIPDPAFGVGLVGEFPVEPYGPPDVLPYELRATMTRDVVRIEAALESTPSWGNFDDPEAQVEGLYQAATGEGLGEWIPASFACPMGGNGGACFRTDALPVIVLITDAPMHNGPDGMFQYTDVRPAPHEFGATMDALRALGILVIGLGARDSGRPTPMDHLRAVARETGAVDERDEPLAFDIGADGDRVGDGVVRAIERLASGVPLDVSATAEDLPGDGVDALTVIREVRPLAADPPDGVRAIEADRFAGVLPGTRVTFEVVVDASGLPEARETRIFRARIVFRAAGRSRLGHEEVVVVVPGLDGGGCDMLGTGS